MTTGASAAPASAYPTLRTPASICFSAANDVCDPGLTAATFALLDLPDWALAGPPGANWAAAIPSAAVPMNWRRFWLMISDMVFLGEGRTECRPAGCGVGNAPDPRGGGVLRSLSPGLNLQTLTGIGPVRFRVAWCRASPAKSA